MSPERRRALILAAIAGIEGAWVALNFVLHPAGFQRFLGFAADRSGGLAGWLLTGVVGWHSSWQACACHPFDPTS
jgi:hypothetical protein